MTSPGILPAALSKLFGLDLADSVEARGWLRTGGFNQLDAWVEAHRADPEAQTEENPE